MGESDIRNERLKKLEKLKSAGMASYPAASTRTAVIAAFLKDFDESVKSSETAVLAGRVMSLRGQGGIIFADIFDGSASLTTGGGRAQMVLQKADMDAESFELFVETADAGDFVECTGVAFRTKRGEKSLKVSSWRMLSKSLLPIPAEWYGVRRRIAIASALLGHSPQSRYARHV